MANWTVHDIKSQYERAELAGWIPQFIDSAKENDFTPDILMAVASRETNMKNIRGDFRGGVYHGYGLMQADIGSFKEWIDSGAWKDPLQAIKKGAEILHEKRREVANLAKAADIELSDSDLLWISLASYNHGSAGSFRSFNALGDPDKNTTGHDYGKDVLKRAKAFRALLAADNFLDETAEIDPQESDDDSTATTVESSPSDAPQSEPVTPQPPAPGPTAEPVANPKAGQAVAPEPATANQAIVGGRPQDDAKQVTQGGFKSLLATIGGTALASITTIIGFIKSKEGLQLIGVICGTALLLALIFRQVLLDWLRLKLNADPSRYNVR